jgi:ribosomal protein S18 acetylase RimI-like enzyme
MGIQDESPMINSGRRNDSRSFIVRRATLQDSDAIASVLRHAFAEFEPQYTPAAFAATVPRAAEIRARYDEGPAWVGVCCDQIVGTVAAVLKEKGAYVRSMAIAPDARGHGLAWQLLDHVEQFARQHDAACLFLSTTPFLFSAIRLYERYGFHRTDDGPSVLFDTPLFTMKKVLRRFA